MAGWIFWLCAAGIVYVYLGYPALVTLLAQLRPGKAAAHGNEKPGLPSVTVVICAYNEEQVIVQKIENTLALDYPAGLLQVVIVADGSDDRTPEIVKTFAPRGVELLFQPERRGKLAAVNRGAAYARGEILVFSDANNMYEKATLLELVEPFADPAVGAVSGAKSILKGDGALGDAEGLYWKYESFLKVQETRLGSCTGVAGEILAVRRALYPSIPETVINDDFFIALSVIRQGARVAYAPRARSFERVSPTAKDEVTRRTRIVAGRYQAMMMTFTRLPWRRPLVVWQIISHKFMRPLVPFFMLLALLANLAAVIWPGVSGQHALLRLEAPFNWLLLAAQAAFYFLAALGSRFGTGKGLKKFLYLPTFLVNSNLAAVLGLVRYLRGKAPAAWQRVARRSS